TPDAVKEKLADAMTQAARSETFMGLAKKKGFTVAPTDEKTFAAFLAEEDAKVKEIFKSAGLYKSK
ncbi:MAG: hypothetical protein V3U44_03380, partial [Alphaproteobacteria bacterium]